MRRPFKTHGSVVVAVMAFALGIALTPAQAETVRIVALGASNAYGQAVGSGNAWPAKLEAMLKAKGYDVSVDVMAVSVGDADQIAARADSIPSGTKVVVYDVGGGNSADRGVNAGAARGQIERSIRAHGAVPVFAGYKSIIGAESPSNANWIQGDTHHHFTAAAHSRVAAVLAPRVIAAIGKKK